MKSGDSFSFIFSEGNRSEVEYYTFYKSMTDRQMVEERGRRREGEGRAEGGEERVSGWLPIATTIEADESRSLQDRAWGMQQATSWRLREG